MLTKKKTLSMSFKRKQRKLREKNRKFVVTEFVKHVMSSLQDKPNADLNMTLDSMEKKLGLKPILTQIPLENGQLIDLINLEILTFDSKGNVEMNKIGLDKTVSLHQRYLHPRRGAQCGNFKGYSAASMQ